MPKAVSVAEAEHRFDALLGYVDQGNEIIVESDGKPRAVLMSFAAFEQVATLRDRDQKRRAAALERLLRLQDQVSARNQDLTEEEAEALAEEITQQAIANMVARGEISFERDRR